MLKDANRVRVQIFGTEYTLRGQASPEHIRRIAALVNDQMNDIAKHNPQLDAKRLAVLAAVNMAEELLTLQAEFREWMSLVERQTTASTNESGQE